MKLNRLTAHIAMAYGYTNPWTLLAAHWVNYWRYQHGYIKVGDWEKATNKGGLLQNRNGVK